MSPAPHVAGTVTGPKDQGSTDPRGSVSLTCEPWARDPRGQSGGSALENDLEAAAPPGILCKRKEKAPGLEAPLGALKAADPPGRCQQRAGCEATARPGRLPAMPGRPPPALAAQAWCAFRRRCAPCGAPSLGVGAAGAGGPASGEGPARAVSQEAAEPGPGVLFPRDRRVTVRSRAVCCGHHASAATRQVPKFRSKGGFT